MEFWEERASSRSRIVFQTCFWTEVRPGHWHFKSAHSPPSVILYTPRSGSHWSWGFVLVWGCYSLQTFVCWFFSLVLLKEPSDVNIGGISPHVIIHFYLFCLFFIFLFERERESVHTQAGNGGRQGPRETERTPSRRHPPHRARRGVWSHDPGSWPELKSRVERSTDRATQASVPSCFVLNSGIIIVTFHEFLCISGFLTLSFSFFPTELRKQKSSVKICYR